MTKRGQGMPLNTIIIAIIVIVVLVVLIAIFVRNIGKTQKDITEQSKIELIAMRVSYSACHPDASAEQTFLSALSVAQTANDANQIATAKSDFQARITACGAQTAAACPSGCTTTAAS